MDNIEELKEQEIFFNSISDLLYKYRIENSINYEFIRNELESFLVNMYENITTFNFTISDNLIINVFSDLGDNGIFEYSILAKIVFNTRNKIQIDITITDYQWNIVSRRILDY